MSPARAVPRVLALALLLAGALRAGPEATPRRLEVGGLGPETLRGVWVGEFRQFDPGLFRAYPMRMELDPDPGDASPRPVTGVLEWPTLGDSASRLVGEIRDNLVEFSEPEQTRGLGLILDGSYRASRVGPDRIEGIWLPPPGVAGVAFGTFVLERSPEAPRGRGWLEKGP